MIWHYPHYHGSFWTPGSAIRSGKWKLVEFYEEEKVELYNLDADIGERNDLASTHPGKARKLRALMHIKLEEMGADYPTKR